MKFQINRIEKVIDGHHNFEHCSIVVSNLEQFRRSIKADEVFLVYEIIT